MAGSFVLALLSKEQALTLPFLAAVYEHFFREDRAETTRGQKASALRRIVAARRGLFGCPRPLFGRLRAQA